MRVAIVALDTRGGVQPYTALARGLRHAGHDVTLLAPADAVAEVGDGVRTVALTAPDAQDVQAAGGVAEMRPLARLRLMRTHMHATVGRTAVTAWEACADADVLTAGIGGMGVATAVAERLDRPFVAAHLQPFGPATGAFPAPLLRLPRGLGRFGNRGSHRLTAIGVRAMFGQAGGLARAALGLSGRPAPVDPGLPVLYGFSPLVVPHPPEWGPRRHITGYWTVPTREDWAPPPDLAAFLRAGAPPVAIGFGSMVSRDAGALTRLVVLAARRAGVRVVLLTGWGGLDARATPTADDVFVAEQVPHDWLFPRCAAVVHHGGAGTTGAALLAGKPAVVVPFAADQPFWASRVVVLGAGPAPVPRRRLTADRLARGLVDALTDQDMRDVAAELGTRLRVEHGVAAAVAHYTALDVRPGQRRG